jgi:hypothetical protein
MFKRGVVAAPGASEERRSIAAALDPRPPAFP